MKRKELTDEAKAEIIKLHGRGVSYKGIAKECKTSSWTVKKVLKDAESTEAAIEAVKAVAKKVSKELAEKKKASEVKVEKPVSASKPDPKPVDKSAKPKPVKAAPAPAPVNKSKEAVRVALEAAQARKNAQKR